MPIRAASASQLPVPQAKKKNTTKKRGERGGQVTMISLLFPAEADQSTLVHLGVALMANRKIKASFTYPYPEYTQLLRRLVWLGS